MDAFGLMFSDFIEEGYFLLKNDQGKVDLYEVISVLSIVNSSDFAERVEFVFCLFDFDQSKTLE